MGYLLKEGLKTLCGVNQWSYAVFWKIGCQNPNLLIWEECYYEPARCSGLDGKEDRDTAFHDCNTSWISAEASNAQAGDKVHLLVNNMMMHNHVNIVGQGLVGRVAFTGNHQWILPGNYCVDSHPPEVVKEVCQQLSAGMQTIAVIPVLPHGVMQFGSTMAIMENMVFINEVTSLILHLGYVSGALQSPNYEHAPRVESSACSFDSFNAVFGSSNSKQQYQFMNGVAKAEVIPSNSEMWKNQSTSLYAPRSNRGLNSSAADSCLVFCSGDADGDISSKHPGRSEPQNKKLHKVELSNSSSVDCFTSNDRNIHPEFGQSESNDRKEMGRHRTQDHGMPVSRFGGQITCMSNTSDNDDNVWLQPESGDDLFDVLGADFKNKLFSRCRDSLWCNESSPIMHSWDDKSNLPPKMSLPSSDDHLLEAVVSKVQTCSKWSTNDTVSCRTSITNTSSASTPNTSLPYGRYGMSEHLKGELFGAPKYLAKAGAMNSSLLTNGPSKEESRSNSQGSSLYRSQISSWMEKDQKAKPSSSVSTGHSKKPDETGKPNRKRLKPGENPRPRPKDRQMIQDRVKELRDIVPNGAKCSIDALLERTIKHMLFLQSVTKHADKLKQTGDSKIVSKDGGFLLKDDFEGGATWAYEVGSQSMVCPIIVEDLNQPRQMLVEMLFEERGLFLEIADIIRGLGLTILKGVMETKNDKIWARFAVEANRDVTRMEIFISLVHLLEQSSKDGSAPQPNNISNDNHLVPHQFHHVASVPLTARTRSLR